MRYVVLILSLSLLEAVSAFAGNGGRGGDTLKSTPAEVDHAFWIATREETTGIPAVMREIQKELVQPGQALHISDEGLHHLFTKMLGTNLEYDKTPMAQDFKATHFKKENEKGCEFIRGTNEKAAVKENKLGVDICVNRPLFEELPPEALPGQFTALLVHEFSHHFGASETQARRVQKFVSYKLNSSCSISVELENAPEGKSHYVFISPRSWNINTRHHDIPPASSSVVVENSTSFEHKEMERWPFVNDSVSSVNLNTHDSGDEFKMNIVRAGPSWLKAVVLNQDQTRSSIELRWNNLDDINPPQSTGPVTAFGKIDGQTLDVDRVMVENDCFNL